MVLTQEEALKKLQQTELEILLMLDGFCEENGIEYWMDGGTFLGAIRHGGFIPWDDDVDLGMMRDDYNRFLELAEDGLPDRYSLHTSRNTKGFAPLFAKVFKDGTRFETQETCEASITQGIFVDIFPYDYLYEDSKLKKKQIRDSIVAQRRSYLYNARTINVPDKGIAGSIEKLACKVAHQIEHIVVCNPIAYQDKYDACIADETKSRVSDECRFLGWDVTLNKDDIVPTSKVSFEGYELSAPCNAEAYLTKMYGAWRELPAPEDRHTHLPLVLDFGDGTVWQSSEA